MADEILKATLQLSRWKRGKGKNDKLFNQLYHKEKYIIRLQCLALLCGVLKTVFGPSDMLLPLDTNHCKQQPMFCQVFPGRIMEQSMLPLAQYEFLLSPSSLSLCGHRTKVWAFRHPVASRLCCSVFSPRPGHACACPVPGHQHRCAWQPPLEPQGQPAPVLQQRCWGVASLQPCQGLTVILAQLVALLSPKPHTSMPALHLKWCRELHLLIMLEVHSHVPPLPQVSLLRPCLAPGTLPCHLPSYHTCFKSSSQPLSFTPTYSLCFQNSTRSQLLSAALPVLPPPSARGPRAPCCTHTVGVLQR